MSELFHRVCRGSQRGFSIVTAIFLLVVLAALGVFILTVSGTQHRSAALDVQGVQAYQAARAGIEWGAYRVLDPNNTLNPATCGTAFVTCPAGSTALPALAGSLSPFTVVVTCNMTQTTEGNRDVRVFAITSTATTGSPGTAGYIERQLQATLSKCHDPTAAAPRCSCG